MLGLKMIKFCIIAGFCDNKWDCIRQQYYAVSSACACVHASRHVLVMNGSLLAEISKTCSGREAV
jgi:hypothetical protein